MIWEMNFHDSCVAYVRKVAVCGCPAVHGCGWTRSTVVHSYLAMNKKFGWGRNTAFCSYFVMNELGWGRSTVVCGYLVLGVLCSYPVVNNELRPFGVVSAS